MRTVDAIAGRVLENSHLGQGGHAKISLATIILVLKAIVMAYECFGNMNFFTSEVRKPGFFARLKLRRVVKRILVQEGVVDELNPVMDGLYETAKDLTYVEIIDSVLELQQA